MSKIFIGVVHHSGITTHCADSIVRLRRLPGFGFVYKGITGCEISTARNMMIDEYLKTDCDYFLGVDADIGFSPADFLSLHSRDLPIVFGAFKYRNNSMPGFYACGHYEKGHCGEVSTRVSTDTKGVVACDWSGAAFWLAKRETLAAINGAWFYQPIYTTKTGQTKVMPETGGFCKNLTEKKYKILVDCDINLIHEKERKMEDIVDLPASMSDRMVEIGATLSKLNLEIAEMVKNYNLLAINYRKQSQNLPTMPK